MRKVRPSTCAWDPPSLPRKILLLGGYGEDSSLCRGYQLHHTTVTPSSLPLSPLNCWLQCLNKRPSSDKRPYNPLAIVSNKILCSQLICRGETTKPLKNTHCPPKDGSQSLEWQVAIDESKNLAIVSHARSSSVVERVLS